MEEKTYEVWVQPWVKWTSATKSEPDGYSIHKTKEHVRCFFNQYRHGLPALTPPEYSLPFGDPYPKRANEETYEQLSSAPFGLRCQSIETSGNYIYFDPRG